MNSNLLFANLPQLETQQLILRQLVETDATALFTILSDPEVVKYTPRQPHKSIEETELLFKQWIALYEHNDVSRWGVVSKIDQIVIVICDFISLMFSEIQARKLSYCLAIRPF